MIMSNKIQNSSIIQVIYTFVSQKGHTEKSLYARVVMFKSNFGRLI